MAPLNIVRDDAATASFVGVPGAAWFVSASVVPGRGYSVAFQGAVPSAPQIFANELTPTDWIKVSFPYPTALINVYRDYNTSASIAVAGSMAELDAGTGDKYFYDPGTGTLHLRAMAKSGRTWAALFVVRR